jgi:hypothetical protein
VELGRLLQISNATSVHKAKRTKSTMKSNWSVWRKRNRCMMTVAPTSTQCSQVDESGGYDPPHACSVREQRAAVASNAHLVRLTEISVSYVAGQTFIGRRSLLRLRLCQTHWMSSSKLQFYQEEHLWRILKKLISFHVYCMIQSGISYPRSGSKAFSWTTKR